MDQWILTNPSDGEITMRVEIVNDNQNWLNWGNLVLTWIRDAHQRPQTVGKLREQMRTHCVEGTVAGPDTRPVQISSYINAPNDPLEIMLPNQQMLDARLATVRAGPYNFMPLFYDIAFGGAPRVNLSQQEALDFASRRIGEYSVNECC
jgi:hypothetical protein